MNGDALLMCMCTCTCYLQMDSMKQKKGQEFDIFWLEKKRGILVRMMVNLTCCKQDERIVENL